MTATIHTFVPRFREKIILDGRWCRGRPHFILIYKWDESAGAIVWTGPDHASALEAAREWQKDGAALVDRWERAHGQA